MNYIEKERIKLLKDIINRDTSRLSTREKELTNEFIESIISSALQSSHFSEEFKQDTLNQLKLY